MIKSVLRKILVCGIIILFMGTSCISSMETLTKKNIINNKQESKLPCDDKTSLVQEIIPVLRKGSLLQDPQRDISDFYACAMGVGDPFWFSSDGYLAPSILPNFPSGSDIDSEGNWYAVDYAGGIYQIFYDGYQVFIAPSIPLNSLTYDTTTELWFGCDATNVYTIDITTGITSIIGPLETSNIIIGIACNLAGEMYGYDVLWTGDSTLFSINKDTGEATAIGSMGYGFIYAQDCAFDRDNDILYIAGYFNDGSPSALLTCDVTTGQCTIVGSFEGGIEVDALTWSYGVSNWTLYPYANFTWIPTTPYQGETIFFNASTSHDYDGFIILYEWDWNNDSVYEEASTIPTTTHLWPSPGDYNVTLRVTDDMGLTATKYNIIEVVSNPPSSPVIYGPDNGFINVSYTFTTDQITDPNGDSFYCKWDWGDGNITGWLGPYPSGSIISASHTWTYVGVYEIRAKIKGSEGESNWSEPHIITIVENQPPEKPIIKGPVVGRGGVAYNFTVVITDPEASMFFFRIDWGDGNTTGWFGPYDAGEEVTFSHAWNHVGTYSIQVKAKDIYGEESNSDLFVIKIVELKKSFLIGVFHNQSETDDLRIIDTNFLIIVPSDSIMYYGVSIVIAKNYRFGILLSSLLGGIFEAARLNK
jgi:hypothetical protein